MPDVMGTLPAWISASGIITLVGILLRNQQINRKLQNEEHSRLGDHTASELASLRAGASNNFRIIGNDLRSPGAGGSGLSNLSSGTDVIIQGNLPLAVNV